MDYEFKEYRFRTWYIPARMFHGIRNYVVNGIKPGNFLTAVFENDLVEAVGRADEENLKNLPAYAAYLYNELPPSVWGSKEKVKAHIEKRFTGELK